jgi:hypothetical protein
VSSLSEITMSYGPLCLKRGMKLLRLSVTFDHRVHNTANEISGRSTKVLDFLIKRALSENCPYKGKNILDFYA